MIEFARESKDLVGRQRSILETLGHGGHVEVSQLAKLFRVSSVTIRKDLQELEARNLLRRVRGGAVATQTSKYEFKIVDTESSPKLAMARAAVHLIEERDVLLLDAGSSVFALAQLLPASFRELTVITNSLPIMALLSKRANFNLVGLGGNVQAFSMALVGPVTVRQLRELRATRVFFSATGATEERGLWVPDLVEAETKSAMLEIARDRIALVEHGKLNDASLASFARWQELDCLISDRELPAAYAEAVGRHGVRFITADEGT